LVGHITGFCGNIRLRGGHLETKSQDLLMHVGVIYIAIENATNKEYMNSINGLAKALNNIIMEIVRKRRTEKSTLAHVHHCRDSRQIRMNLGRVRVLRETVALLAVLSRNHVMVD
jgi:hypothetical protein